MTSPSFVDVANNTGVTFVDTDGTTKKTIVTASANGTKVSAIVVNSSEDTVNKIIELYFNDGTTSYLLSATVIPMGAGVNGSPGSELLTDQNIYPIDNNGNPEIVLRTGESLELAMQSAVTLNKTITATALARDF